MGWSTDICYWLWLSVIYWGFLLWASEPGKYRPWDMNLDLKAMLTWNHFGTMEMVVFYATFCTLAMLNLTNQSSDILKHFRRSYICHICVSWSSWDYISIHTSIFICGPCQDLNLVYCFIQLRITASYCNMYSSGPDCGLYLFWV